MFDEKQLATRLEDPSYLAQRGKWVGNRTKRPGHHNRVYRIIRKRDRGRRTLHEFGDDTGRNSASARNREQMTRRVDPKYDLDLLAIKRKVQPRSDPDFEHTPISRGSYLATVFLELALPHDQIEDGWQYPAVIDFHDGLARIAFLQHPMLL